MSAATQTGAELRAWRERLELSVEWAAKIISDAGLNRTAQDVANLEASCCIARDWFATAPVYAAALTAEEQRRSAAPLTEPVAPEGVRVEESACGSCTVRLNDIVCFRVRSYTVSGEAKTEIATVISGQHWPAWLARYAADLADYRAAQHAAGEQQRKLNAVRAAEEAFKEADATYSAALDARDTARKALNAAKREAGL